MARQDSIGDIMGDTEEYLIETADRCNRLARELAASLEAMSNDLMARAVALDIARDKKQAGIRRSKS